MLSRTFMRVVPRSLPSATPSFLPSFNLLARRYTPSSSSSSTPSSTDPSNNINTEDPYAEYKFGYGSQDNLFESVQRDAADIEADPTNRAFTYFVQGTAAFCYASVARAAVHKFVNYLSASGDVLALASVEVDIGGIAEGSAATVKWRGKPVFIRHRTAKEIAQARTDDSASLRDPQTDAERFSNDKWAILIGVCTHLGCVPMNAAGDYNGWFCPCHGSHYDTSGRIRKGPAPLNLAVPQYKFLSDTKVLLG